MDNINKGKDNWTIYKREYKIKTVKNWSKRTITRKWIIEQF